MRGKNKMETKKRKLIKELMAQKRILQSLLNDCVNGECTAAITLKSRINRLQAVINRAQLAQLF